MSLLLRNIGLAVSLGAMARARCGSFLYPLTYCDASSYGLPVLVDHDGNAYQTCLHVLPATATPQQGQAAEGDVRERSLRLGTFARLKCWSRSG